MKNYVIIKHSFGEVELKVALPSVEDFVSKLAKGIAEDTWPHINTECKTNHFCPELRQVYHIGLETITGDFYRSIQDYDDKHFCLSNNWGDNKLCFDGYLNFIPFLSKGIGAEKTLKFKGMYTNENLEKVKSTLYAFVNYVKESRRPVTIQFEVEDSDQDITETVVNL